MKNYIPNSKSLLSVALLAAFGASLDAYATAYTVTEFTDTASGGGAGTGAGVAGDLRNAINQANTAGGSNTIGFACGTPPCQINLTGPLPPITSDLIIDGSTSGNIVIDGASSYRVFFVDTGTVTLARLKIQFARAMGGAGGGTGGLAGGGGGGGAGLGAGVFVNKSTAVVNLINVDFLASSVFGGNGGAVGNNANAGSGGGGLAFAGGNANDGGGGAGGGGVTGAGVATTTIDGSAGGTGGGGGGGRYQTGVAGLGGAAYAGNAAGANAVTTTAGAGGFGGGGGGAAIGTPGAGGFGGGGGGTGSASAGGAGGAGGGGGGTGGGLSTTHGAGGTLGGGISGGQGTRGGGGGAAAGPDIFVKDGVLTTTSSTTTGSFSVGGAGGNGGTATFNGAAGGASSVPVFNYNGTINGSTTVGGNTTALTALATVPFTPAATTFIVTVPADKPQVAVSDPKAVIDGVPIGTIVSDNGVVILPDASGNGTASTPVVIAANSPNNVVIQLSGSTPTSFTVGGQTFTLTPASGSTTPVQVQTKTVSVTDSNGVTRSVSSLQVIQGNATLTGPSGQVLSAFGANSNSGCSQNAGYIIPLISNTAISASASDTSWLLLGHVDSGSANFHFTACAASGNVFSATGQDVVVYRGEQVFVDKGAQVARIVVRSASGTAGDAGDSLATILTRFVGTGGYTFAGFVPQLSKDTGRLPAGSTLQSRLSPLFLAADATPGLAFQGQNSLGVLSYGIDKQELMSALPVGAVTVQPGKADGRAVLDSGQVQVVANENVVTFNAAPRDPARLLSDLRTSSSQGANVRVVADGSLRLVYQGRILAMQPAWSAVYNAANIGKDAFVPAVASAAQFCHFADGWQQCYFPTVNNFVALQAIVLKADAKGSVTQARSGLVTVKLLGNTYNIFPDWEVIDTPASHAADDFWVDGSGRFYIRSADGYSQGFAIR